MSLQGHAVIPGPVTREDLGRSTWLLLHTLAAQYPERPSKQQRKDVAALVSALFTLTAQGQALHIFRLLKWHAPQVDTLTRIYPCGECAQHFQEVVR